MAKKKKFKLKARQKAQILQQLRRTSTAAPSIVPVAPAQTSSSQILDATQQKITYRSITPIDDVRADIKKIGLVVGILAILLTITVVADKKYNYSLKIGQKITKGLGI